MDKQLIKKLLRKTHLVKYCYENCSDSRIALWTTAYLLDACDRKTEFDYIMEHRYDLNRGVYLYHCARHRFKLIAIINNKGIKLL